MVKSVGLALLLSSFWSVATGLALAQDRPATTTPPPPSQDPFYVAPRGYKLFPHGTILRSRRLSGLSISVPVQDAYQLLYSTTDGLGRPGTSVTTVIVPPGANTSQHLAYHAPYDAANIDCGPSYALVAGSKSNYSSSLQFDGQVLEAALNRGIIVSASDYEGGNPAFTAGPQTAHGTLDAVRAVIASGKITGISPRAKTALLGYSGGSIAVEWASEFQATYAPELNIAAAALGGLPVNLTTALFSIAASPSPGLVFASLNGLALAYPSFALWLSANLIPSKAKEFYEARELCQTDATGASGGYTELYAGQDFFSYFRRGKAAFNSLGFTSVILRAGRMGLHGIPRRFPLYIYKGTADDITPNIQETDALVQKFCDAGATVKYTRYIDGQHVGTAEQGTPDALAFVFDVLDGNKVSRECTTRDIPATPAA